MAANDNRSPVLTIVGGQPSKLRKHDAGEVPGGIGEILGRAARDVEFRRRLIEDRKGSLEGFSLTSSETAALGAVDDSALIAMIDGYHE